MQGKLSSDKKRVALAVLLLFFSFAMTPVWADELESMRLRLLAMREGLAAALAGRGVDGGYLLRQKGMFSYTCLPADAIHRLREKHAVYLTDDGRMNVAGLNAGNLDRVAAARAEVERP